MLRLRNTALASVAAFGGIVFASGWAFPVYSDAEAALRLRRDACDANGVVEGWYDRMAELETLRHPLMQSGLSIMLVAATLWVLYLAFGSAHSWRFRSPSKKWIFFLLGFGVIGLSFFSQLHSLSLDLRRGVFPHCADTIAIPAFGLAYFYGALTLACLMFGALFVAFFRPLPVDLFTLGEGRGTVRRWLPTVLFGLLALPIVIFGILGAAGSSFIGTPAAVVGLYLVESARSAVMPADG